MSSQPYGLTGAMKPTALLPIDNEPPPRLIVDPPLAGPLSEGRVFIQYRTENLRVVPVFGEGALTVSPRIGHVHVTVDDARWHFIDASGETLVLVGLEPGEHQILVELADPVHRVLDRHLVRFRVPDSTAPRIRRKTEPRSSTRTGGKARL
jgi:hypothetical protein